jgi:hypothetical protein
MGGFLAHDGGFGQDFGETFGQDRLAFLVGDGDQIVGAFSMISPAPRCW